MSNFDVQAAKKWLGEVPGGSLTDDFELQWKQFETEPKPVVTVFGSYDTGKSSLIRRLLVDAGVEVPEWLTISARHETFEVRGVELAGCVIRDTPGLAVGAQDVRGEVNTQLAQEAIGLTDIAIVTVTPQLATGERDLVQELIDSGWSTGALWFVISRFDEAGRDPDSDLDGYQELAQRKIAELRESLGLGSDTPVFVVAQDAFQFAGADRGVERDIWDDTRGWDGMADLSSALEHVSGSNLGLLRAATEQRFWSQAVVSVVGELRVQLVQFETAAADARELKARKDQWESALGVLDTAAQAGLKGALQQSIRQVLANPNSSQERIVAAIQSALEDWYQKVGREVDLLLQDIAKSANRQRTEPSWNRLEAFVAQAVADSTSAGEPDVTRIAPILAKLGPKLVAGIVEFDRLNRKRAVYQAKSGPNGTAGMSAGWSPSDKANAAKAVLSIVVVVAGLVDDYRRQRATANQLRENMRALGDQLEADAAKAGLAEWQKVIHGAREDIDLAVGAGPELSDRLIENVETIRSHLSTSEIQSGGGAKLGAV